MNPYNRIIHPVGAIPVPGPMQTTGVPGVRGSLSRPLCIPTRYVLRLVEGSSPASQVVQGPLRALFSFVLYFTNAVHSSIDLGCFCLTHVRDSLATRGGRRAHFDGTCDRELSGPHEWEEVEYVLLRHVTLVYRKSSSTSRIVLRGRWMYSYISS